MVDTDKLLGIIKENRMTQQSVAKGLGITSKTFGLKLKKRVFSSNEIEGMIEILHITDPVAIFFKKEVE